MRSLAILAENLLRSIIFKPELIWYFYAYPTARPPGREYPAFNCAPDADCRKMIVVPRKRMTRTHKNQPQLYLFINGGDRTASRTDTDAPIYSGLYSGGTHLSRSSVLNVLSALKCGNYITFKYGGLDWRE